MDDRLANLLNGSSTLGTHCPVCGLPFDPLEARVIEERQTGHLLHIKCANCHSAILAVIVANSLGLTSVGLATDLSGEEVHLFKDAKPISSDDVLEVHQFLNREKVIIDYID
ncbi:MAG: hypothetical protein RB292_01595 [Patescibacteria group bacterium]|jgi:hypothetical protein|nr:hypothetical protein [Patescibacteria group bacterium]